MVDTFAVINALKSLSLAEEKLDRNDHEELGRGAYGRVFKMKYCGQYFAAKEIHSILLNGTCGEQRDGITQSFLRECYHCFNLRHPNIVQFIGVYWNDKRSDLPVMVMELMDCSLRNFIDKHPQTDTKLKYSILHDVTVGLSFLHAQSPPVIHRDLSPNNILLTKQFVAKIGDLGVSKAIQAGGKAVKRNAKLTKVPGTPDFMPPEACWDNPVYDTSLDVFSFGGITLYLAIELWPSPTAATTVDPDTRQLRGLTEVERRSTFISKMDEAQLEDLKELVKSCLDNDPKMRPAIHEVSEQIESLKDKSSKVCSYIAI